jgi:signal peptidase I
LREFTRLRWAVRVLLLVGVVVLLLRLMAIGGWPQAYVVTGPSMGPTVHAGEYFIATGPVKHIRRGMLVIFRYDDDDGVFHVLRRLVGLPGDTVALRDGRAVVNGEAMSWPFRIIAPKAWRSLYVRGENLYTWGPVRVPRDSVLLLSDTRDMLGFPDSRFIGPVAIGSLEAEARWAIWAPGRGLLFRSLRRSAAPAKGPETSPRTPPNALLTPGR